MGPPFLPCREVKPLAPRFEVWAPLLAQGGYPGVLFQGCLFTAFPPISTNQAPGVMAWWSLGPLHTYQESRNGVGECSSRQGRNGGALSSRPPAPVAHLTSRGPHPHPLQLPALSTRPARPPAASLTVTRSSAPSDLTCCRPDAIPSPRGHLPPPSGPSQRTSFCPPRSLLEHPKHHVEGTQNPLTTSNN